MKPQAIQIAEYLREHGSITAREAMALQPPCFRLAPRILEIRRELGEERIRTVNEPHEGGTHARYEWVEPAQSDLFDSEAA